jgi:uncharacterized membrane protein
LDANDIFVLGNILLLIAAFPLLLTVWKNRDALADFHPIGATLTFAGLIAFWWAYIVMGNWLAILVNLPTALLWGLASWYSVKRWRG